MSQPGEALREAALEVAIHEAADKIADSPVVRERVRVAIRAALAAPVAGVGLDELTRDVAASTNVAKWVLPLVLAVRAWRDTPRTRDMRVGQRLELAILDAINDLDEYGADT